MPMILLAICQTVKSLKRWKAETSLITF